MQGTSKNWICIRVVSFLSLYYVNLQTERAQRADPSMEEGASIGSNSTPSTMDRIAPAIPIAEESPWIPCVNVLPLSAILAVWLAVGVGTIPRSRRLSLSFTAFLLNFAETRYAR